MSQLKPNLRDKNQKISLNWTQLNAIITGVSAIDMGSLAIRTREEANAFAREYGFDLENPRDWAQINAAHHEAVAFIEDFFLTKDQRECFVPEVREPESVLDLLVFSSNYLKKSNVRQLWACAVLKVMHGIFHIQKDLKLMYFEEIRRQVFSALDRLICSNGSNHYLSDGATTIPLFFYEKKRNKDARSILLKLLQKPTYVAADIYDHLGARFIFETKFECLMALKLLRKCHQISVTNIKPFRTRNNLVNLRRARKIFNQFRPLLERAEEYPLDILRKMDQELDQHFKKRQRTSNPHSSADFQSIQITIRKMIHLGGDHLVPSTFAYEGADRPLHHSADNRASFYFDYEIQLMDKNSYLRSLHGPSSHIAYKRRQTETARKRVLGSELIQFLEEKSGRNQAANVIP